MVGPRAVRCRLGATLLSTLMLGVLSTSVGVAAWTSLAMQNRSFDFLIWACVGQWLGFAGILLGRRMKSGRSPLSMFGTTLCVAILSPFYLLLLLPLVVLVPAFALPIFGACGLIRALNRRSAWGLGRGQRQTGFPVVSHKKTRKPV